MRYRILDLFCGAGGCSEGYRRAGLIPFGVDLAPQPRYPYQFARADALEFLRLYGHEFDVIHASPPCQGYSEMNRIHKREYQQLIGEVRKLLITTGKPYIIENVPGARKYMHNPITLCGAYFGLKTYRHRLFESNLLLFQPPHEPHQDNTPSAGRGMSDKGFISVTGSGGFGFEGGLEYAKTRAMQISWMNRAELSQAIPPAYTEFIGRQLVNYLTNAENINTKARAA